MENIRIRIWPPVVMYTRVIYHNKTCYIFFLHSSAREKYVLPKYIIHLNGKYLLKIFTISTYLFATDAILCPKILIYILSWPSKDVHLSMFSVNALHKIVYHI